MAITNYPAVITSVDRIKRQLNWLRHARYLWLGLMCYGAIAGTVYVYLHRPAVFASGMSLVLPGSGSSSSFSIEDVGAASQDTKNAFNTNAFNPLVNYKEILRSNEVVKAAARALNVDVRLTPKPDVELKEQTSILVISTEGMTAQAAKEYAWALYDAFQTALDQLRADEMLRKDNSVRAVLDKYRLKVASTRQAIVEFQQRALLVSVDQLNQLVQSISSLKERTVTLQSSVRFTDDYVRKLSLDLGISPSLAGKAFMLQSDAEFRGYLGELNESATLLAQYSSRWGNNHPKVIAQQQRYELAKQSLRKRSLTVIGQDYADSINALDLEASSVRATLFSNLIEASAKYEGELAQLNEMLLAQNRMQDQLIILTREAAELERLEREYRLAEAVFTSAAANLEAAQSDVFASYPIIQMLSVPTLPDKPKSPNTQIAVVIGGMGILFVTFGLLSLWHRRYFIQKLLAK